MYRPIILMFFALQVLLYAVHLSAQVPPLLKERFEKDPKSAGWLHTPFNTGKWVEEDVRKGNHFISSKDGKWESPAFKVTPLKYYKLSFWSKGDPAPYGHYYCLFFENSKGKELVADHYGSFDPSGTWVKHEYCVRAKVDSSTARVRFQQSEGSSISIDDVKVESVDSRQVATWAYSIYQELPALKYVPPQSRFRYIPKTMRKLRTGGTLRIVMLGDSIINDTGNSPFDVLLLRYYPTAKIEVITSVRGGTGTAYYRDENRVKSYVVELKPDLVIIGGISGTKPEDNEDCIQQIRALGCRAEIMLMTGPVTPRFDPEGKPWSLEIDPDGDSPRRSELLKEAIDHKYAFLDIQSPFSQYESYSGLTSEHLRRDAIHANDRARAILAKIIEKWFTSDSTLSAK